MHQPATTQEPSPVISPEPSLAKGDAMQAILSGAVFGALGALAGNWLGGKGGEHGPRMMGKKFMTWASGVVTGMVALYVSLKTTSQMAAAPPPDEEAVIIKKPLMDAPPFPARADAASVVEEVAHDGRLQPQQRARA